MFNLGVDDPCRPLGQGHNYRKWLMSVEWPSPGLERKIKKKKKERIEKKKLYELSKLVLAVSRGTIDIHISNFRLKLVKRA